LKQLAGVVGEGVTQSITSALKKGTVTTLKQVAKNLPDANQKTTKRGGKASFASKLQGTLEKMVSGSQQKVTKPSPHSPHQHAHKQGATSTHVPARGHHPGHQQVEKYPESEEYVLYQDAPDDGDMVEGFEGVDEQPWDWEGTDGQEPGEYVEVYEYADGELEVVDDEEFREDEETGNELGGDGPYSQEDSSKEEVVVRADYGDQVQGVEYAGSEPGGDDGGDEGQDDGDEEQDDGVADTDSGDSESDDDSDSDSDDD